LDEYKDYDKTKPIVKGRKVTGLFDADHSCNSIKIAGLPTLLQSGLFMGPDGWGGQCPVLSCTAGLPTRRGYHHRPVLFIWKALQIV